MAEPSRLILPAPDALSSWAALIGYGPLGGALVDLLGGAVVQPAARVLVADHLPDALAEETDEIAHRFRVPWLAVEAEHQRVVVGPLVVPGKGPCHACFRRRRVQHDAQWPLTEALRAAQTREESLRPYGFLPHHLRLIAGVVRSVSTGPTRPGTVVTVPLNRSAVRRDLVVGCHGCPRCGAETSSRPELGALLGLWQKEGADSAVGGY